MGILDAARRAFARAGFHGARMQEIADQAGINKAMLHYYFRSKEALFERVFNEAYSEFLPKTHAILTGPGSALDKIEQYVHEHLQLLLRRPDIPMFVLTEVHQDPDRFFKIFLSKMPSPPPFLGFIKQLETEMEAGTLRKSDPRDLWYSVMALVVFPFIARPMLEKLTVATPEQYDAILQNRKHTISQLLRHGIGKKTLVTNEGAMASPHHSL
ncbi:MAG: TetR/AcrR family transcriptional regulator [Bacteroidota bacterium]